MAFQGAMSVVGAQGTNNDRPDMIEYFPNFSSDFIKQASSEVNSENPQDAKTYRTWFNSLQNIANLPKGSPESIIAGVISIILSIGGTLAFIAMMVAGVMYVIAHDNEEMVQKAKKLLVYAIVGLVLISVSFAIFTGLSTIVFT